MGTFDRSKFKAAKLEANKAASAAAESTLKQNVGSSKRGDYHKIDEGANYFRIMPPHSPEDPSWQPKVVTWLEVLVEERDGDGNPTGKKERKGRPIFDSRIHGGTQKDIIDQYILFVKKKVYDESQDQEAAKKKLAPIFGYRDSKGTWHPGILPNSSYVCYATKNGISPENLGRLEVYKPDKDKIEELNIDEGSDEPILTDAFSDPDEGVELCIILQKNEKGKYERILKKKEPSLKGLKGPDKLRALEEFEESQRVTDAVLEALSEMDSLESMFKNAYKRSDFEKALEALQFLDNKYNFGVFEMDEFLDVVEEIDGYYSDEVESKKEETETKPELTASQEENFEELTPSDIDEMTRTELKKLISEKNLGIRVTSATSDDDLRELILSKLWPEESNSSEEEDLPMEEENKLPITNRSVEGPNPPKESSGMSLKERLAAKRRQEGQ